MPLLGDPFHKDIVHSLTNRVPKILHLDDPARRPRAIVVVTAHWQTAVPSVTTGASPGLYYDYGGFPPEAYTLTYPARGDPGVAAEVADALRAEGLEADARERDWDHGVFVPMKLIRPEADVPVVQVSVLASEDPAEHLAVGRALGRLRRGNVAIVGSGFASFHNLRHMMPMMRGGSGADAEGVRRKAEGFSMAVDEALRKGGEGLKGWRGFPGADDMHPPRGGDHFMPLIVCAGAAAAAVGGKGGEEVRSYRDDFLGVDVWTWYWGASEDVDEGDSATRGKTEL